MKPETSLVAPSNAAAMEACRAVLAERSKSFALASKLLPPAVRDDVTVLYAWCRAADDAVDDAPPGEAEARLATVRQDLSTVYGDAPTTSSALLCLRDVVQRHGVPRAYPSELLDGMEMDVVGARYESLDDLLLYCHRAAGTVGLMMSHVLGVDRPGALRHAAHLGMAMQLTNVCRDVAEDLERGRVYLPESWLRALGATELLDVAARQGSTEPAGAVQLSDSGRRTVSAVVARLLAEAELLYQSGDRGLSALDVRSAIAVRAARYVYSAIGGVLRGRGHDPFRGRAFVGAPRKILLASWAAVQTLLSRGPFTDHPRIVLPPTPVAYRELVPVASATPRALS